MQNCINHKQTREIPDIKNPPKLSIIIPIYNGAKFIKQALLSIQNQNFDDLEIIFIDDKSTDNSLEILKSEAQKDKRITILKNKKNRGTLYTKVRGILKSKAKYFLLLDQDDLFTTENAFKILYEEAEKTKADFVHFRFFESPFSDLKINFEKSPRDFNKVLYPENIPRYLKDLKSNIYFWDKLYKTSNFQSAIKKLGSNYYKIYMLIHEDIILNALNCVGATSYYAVDDVFYWHNTGNENAVTHNGSPIMKRNIREFFVGLCKLLDITFEIDRDSSKKSNFVSAMGRTAWYVNTYKRELEVYRKDMRDNCRYICGIIYDKYNGMPVKIKKELLPLCGFNTLDEVL